MQIVYTPDDFRPAAADKTQIVGGLERLSYDAAAGAAPK
jgi:hypothetical protein